MRVLRHVWDVEDVLLIRGVCGFFSVLLLYNAYEHPCFADFSYHSNLSLWSNGALQKRRYILFFVLQYFPQRTLCQANTKVIFSQQYSGWHSGALLCTYFITYQLKLFSYVGNTRSSGKDCAMSLLRDKLRWWWQDKRVCKTDKVTSHWQNKPPCPDGCGS